ncbi:MAG TPA: MBL fold metallo-hydrolase [Mycobacteriales bacterium]|nr:MBL fold metallo-hydrolase [Mycobacteriales bacterium]
MPTPDVVSGRARRVLAPNPGPMTLEGTNTWLLAEPGSTEVVVVDPGPDDPGHLAAIRRSADDEGQRIALVVLTHGHPDHSAGARSLAAGAGVAIRAFDPAHRLGDEGLGDGDLVEISGLELRGLATPGHSADHVCLVMPAESAVLTGDHVLGRGTSVVAHPDGRMADYLRSLERLRDLGASRLLPGHGPVVDDPATVIEHYIAHRRERLDQLVTELGAMGLATPRELVERIYADVDPVLWFAAEMSLRAALEVLVDEGRAAVDADGRHELLR